MKSSPGPIVVRLMDGLGNQLFQYALGRNLARLRGAELVLDLSWYGRDASPAQPRRLALFDFSVKGRAADGEDFSRFWIRPTKFGRVWWRLQQRFLPPRLRQFVEQDSGTFADRGQMFDRRVLDAVPGTYLSGWWISPKYFEGAEAELRQDLVLRGPLTDRAEFFVERIRGAESVAIHVRRGDYKNHPNIGLLPGEYYARSLERLRSLGSDQNYFLFSDDVREAKAMLDGIVPHLEVVELEDGTSAAVDLAVMAECKHFIIANSTFSWWGAWLGNCPGKVVIAPEHWYSGARVAMKDVYPDSWFRVPD